MKYCLPILAALTLASVSMPVFAQSDKYGAQPQDYGQAQQACEGDVYKLCGEAIPDQHRIVACLRKKFSKVSKPCREALEDYSKHHHRRHRSSRHHSTTMGSGAKY